MAAGQTTFSALINSVLKTIVGGQDASNNLSPGHTLFDVNAAPFGVSANPLTITGGTAVIDGLNATLRGTVSQFHNSDDQLLPGTAYGLLTGGVAQLVNPAAGVDRQRETGSDNIPASGIATGTAQLKSRITTTLNGASLINAVTLTLTATKFTNRGVACWVQIGTILTIEPGTTNQEQVRVAAVNYGTQVVTITGNGTGRGCQFAHANSVVVSGGAYNESVDATIADGSSPAGIPAGGTYLFNAASNAGAGGVEFERSFNGELMGATGIGAAIAVEYEDTGGGPLLANGTPSNLRLLPAQALLGVGFNTAAITSSLVGNTSIVFGSSAATNTIASGHAIQLTGSGTTETVFTTAGWVSGSSATVPLVSPVVNAAQVVANWSSFAANGPGLTGFLPHGIGIEEEALYNPVDGKFYLERSATQDAMPGANIVAECPAVWNGATFDRATGSIARGADTNARSGFSSTLNITAATVVKASAGRAVRVSVIVPGSASGTLNDCTTTGAVAVANQTVVIPNTIGVIYLDWPHQTGITVVPGTTMTLAISYT